MECLYAEFVHTKDGGYFKETIRNIKLSPEREARDGVFCPRCTFGKWPECKKECPKYKPI